VQADERQFVHCRYEPEWKDGKSRRAGRGTLDSPSFKRAEGGPEGSKDRLQSPSKRPSSGHTV